MKRKDLLIDRLILRAGKLVLALNNPRISYAIKQRY